VNHNTLYTARKRASTDSSRLVRTLIGLIRLIPVCLLSMYRSLLSKGLTGILKERFLNPDFVCVLAEGHTHEPSMG